MTYEPIDANCIKLPLELLDFVHEKIFDGLSVGEGHLQETAPFYKEIVRLVMTELHRLYVEAE
jgi:hypothetical protein